MKKSTAVVFTLFLALFMSFASVSAALASRIDVTVKGMICESCAKTMKRKLGTQNGVQKVSVDLKKGLVHVTMKDGTDLSDDQIKQIVNDPDYTVASIHRN